MSIQPFYEAPGGDASRPRLLLVTWHFSPGQAAGALRWEKLAGHAARRGWELDVVTLDPAQVNRRDDRRLDGLPPGTRVFAARAEDPPSVRVEEALHQVWRRLRPTAGAPAAADAGEGGQGGEGGGDAGGPGSLARDETRLRPWSIGDLRRAFFAWLESRRQAAWAAEAAGVGLRATTPQTRVVVSCGPPHMAHDAARRVAKSTALPLVIDLRDPWSQVQRLPEHHASPLWYALAAAHERRCVEAAELIVANTGPARDALAAAYPGAADRIYAVMNGFDDDPLPEPPATIDRFVIVHAGTVYLDRDPRPLFAAIREVADRHQAGPDRIGLQFLGCMSEHVRRIAEEEGVADYLELVPFLPRDELARRLVTCAVLAVLPQDSDMAIPSKVFEYLRYPAWILAMAEVGSATERVLRDTPAAVVSAGDRAALVDLLDGWFERFGRGERPSPVADVVAQLSRRAQADLLFDALGRFAES